MGCKNVILNGDVIDKLRGLLSDSVDSIVTDPPYELGFMGKKWDASGIAYDVDMWKECLRVLKPGGFLLSFGGTRTYHRMTCGIEDAGFEIRDCIQWIYGSGFPKSHNVGKAVDKLQGNEREVIEVKEHTWNQDNKSIVSSKNDCGGTRRGLLKDDKFSVTKGSSDWEGWGTALKPANEPIVVARKPLSEKTVALNVLKWGTGGINIDGCRIGTDVDLGRKNKDKQGISPFGVNDKSSFGSKDSSFIGVPISEQGRFPANIILDEEAGKLLDEQSGVSKSQRVNSPLLNIKGNNYGRANGNTDIITERGFNDKGGASRFFYCAKASKSERNKGCEMLDEKFMNGLDKMGGEKCGMKTGSGNPRLGVNSNNHPTVKPIKLMQYLVRLVTPPEGIVLDPFIGSGTTGIAALKENINFIGIEKNQEYVDIAMARLKPYLEQKVLR